VLNQALKDTVTRHVLPRVQTPAQYTGGEWNSVRKDHGQVAGKLCLAFPDAYTIGMSHLGLQLLYALMNGRDEWLCERAFAPWLDMERALREQGLPLYSLESFTPLAHFDVLGFSLQYELCVTNILTMLDLGGIPLRAVDRTMRDPLVIAGGPCAQNPEPLAPFIDVFVIGDGEPSLPRVCDLWLAQRDGARRAGWVGEGRAGGEQRGEALARLAAALPFCYVPRFYAPEYRGGRLAALTPTRPGIPETVQPCVLEDLDAAPVPSALLVPLVECVHDRISLEIMRGCPWQCRFCQGSAIKRPVRRRGIESIVNAAVACHRSTGYNEVSLLSLSSSDYPDFPELMRRLKQALDPLAVHVSVPSLRVNEQLRTVAQLVGNTRRSGLTLAPEAARDDMRARIGKQIRNDDLFEGCRTAFRNDYESVKLYFMCGLPGERPVDLDGIVEMAESISHLGVEERGRPARVTASVSNFIPKPHTALQWNSMQTRDYFRRAHAQLRHKSKVRSVQIKCHDIEASLLEGVLSRGDRRVGEAIELAWRRGARMDGWSEQLDAGRWWNALQDAGVDVEATLHRAYALDDLLPWDHIGVRCGRAWLAKEQQRATAAPEHLDEPPDCPHDRAEQRGMPGGGAEP